MYDYGARFYDPSIAQFVSVDPMASALPSFSSYMYAANNPISYIDYQGLFPWPVSVRSFISSNKTGGFFRGDGRGANVINSSPSNTSRVRSQFVVDPSANSVSQPVTVSDPTVFYPGEVIAGKEGRLLPPVSATGTPSGSITNEKFGNGSASFNFSHEGKDPLTPSLITPDLDVNASLSFNEDLANGVLAISGSFTGDSFPSTEAFITDQSGVNLFLGAKREQGGLHSLFGENNNNLINVDMKVLFDKNGNFTGVKNGDQTFTIKQWNKFVKDEF